MSKQKITADETYVYNLSPRVLDSLQLMYFDSSTTQEILPQIETPTVHQDTKEQEKAQVKSKDYYKSDLHRLNLKRELRGLPKLSEEQFEELADELNESISGSEESGSESESESGDVGGDLYSRRKDTLSTIFEKSIEKLEALKIQEDRDDGMVTHLATRSPFLLFKSGLLDEDKVFGIYKSLFTIKELETPIEALRSWNTSQNSNKKSALFMIGGGHFAGAIISHKQKSTKGNTVKQGDTLQEQAVDIIAQKSFHRYTTRKKQGGSQSASDNTRGKAKSVGSSLRRANEAALQQEVRELLQSWKGYLEDCESIFIRANGASNRGILVGYENAVLKSTDERLKTFPFTTKRATATELKRAWVRLTTMTITDKPKVDDKKLKQKENQEKLKQSTVQKAKETEELSPDEKHTVEMVGYLKKSRGPVLMSYLKKYKLSPNFQLQPESEYYTTPTLLHYASAHGIKNLIPVLVKTAKADITIKSKNNKTPYDVAANKQVRQAFQILRSELGEAFTDWEKGNVGKPITREEVERDEKAEKEREEEEKKELIKRELAKKVEVVNPSKHVRLGGVSLTTANLSTLSEDQQKRLMREQRARAAEARMRAAQEQRSG